MLFGANENKYRDCYDKINEISEQPLVESYEGDVEIEPELEDVVVPMLPNNKFEKKKDGSAGNPVKEAEPKEAQFGSVDANPKLEAESFEKTFNFYVVRFFDKGGNERLGTWSFIPNTKVPKNIIDNAKFRLPNVGTVTDRPVGFNVYGSDTKYGNENLIFTHKEPGIQMESFEGSVDESPMKTAKENVNAIDRVKIYLDDIFMGKFIPPSKVKFDQDSSVTKTHISDSPLRESPKGW